MWLKLSLLQILMRIPKKRRCVDQPSDSEIPKLARKSGPGRPRGGGVTKHIKKVVVRKSPVNLASLTAIQHQISELTSRLTGLSELQTSLIPKQPNDSTPQVPFSSLFAQQNASPTLEEATFVSKVSVRLQDSVKRQKNIIIMGAKENNNTQNQDKDTTDYVSKLFKFLKLNNLIIKGCKRLRGVGSYPGIIKVFLNSSEDRQAVLKSTKSLRTSHVYKDVYINPDLIPEEIPDSRYEE